MSFITKRERVFNEYDLYDLPNRNEGKLKAYASCTDARAWSHFGSDKTEHLVDIIKRNNEVCRPKYVPTEAIVNTLLAHKQKEIARLKRKIEEFEQIVAAYDDLELSCEQKCEIAKAHTAIKEANKDLNELWFDLDLSGYTGIDSEDFETGKSRGDELGLSREEEETPRSAEEIEKAIGDEAIRKLRAKTARQAQESARSTGNGGTKEGYYTDDEWSPNKDLSQKESKGNQASELKYISDASTNVVDPRIQELQDVIVGKDAKLIALRNTHMLIENDVVEPYCIYAHIYTALEKIFGILCQNDKYKLYLNLMTAGKDTRGIDIKGKILFKLKVLEKFSLALISPCSREMQSASADPECSCYRAEVISNVETAYALTSAEVQKPIDNKRAQLVADIMENDEMMELLNKDCKEDTDEDDLQHDDINYVYNIDQENVKRLKNLQQNYDELMNCYEELKHEKDCLQIRCRKYEELEKECEAMQNQLREYNSLWAEKEHYRKRSHDLDSLKEQYLVLCDETTSLEISLKAENEINEIKNKSIEELRCENLILESKLNEAAISFEKERNSAQCKLKESECTIMCQEEQIKSLSLQIDRLLEQDPEKIQSKHSDAPAIGLIDEINSLKEQIKNLQDALYCNEEEKQQLQDEYQNKLNLINDLKMEIEDWKSTYEKTLERNDYLEKYTESFRDEVNKLIEENKILSHDVDEKSNAIENLINMLNSKSAEVNKLMDEIDMKNKENNELFDEIRNLHNTYGQSISALDNEKLNALQSLHIAKKESQELLDKVKDYNDIVHQQESLSRLYEKQIADYNELKSLLLNTQKQNEALQMDLNNREKNNTVLLQEIQTLKEANNNAADNINSLKEEKDQYKLSLELTEKDSKIMENKLQTLEEVSLQFQQLKDSYKNLLQEKLRLEKELADKTLELDQAMNDVNLTRTESQELELKLKDSEKFKIDYGNVETAYKKLKIEQQSLKLELEEKKQDLDSLLDSYNNLKNDLERISDLSSKEIEGLKRELAHLQNAYDELIAEKYLLQNALESKTEENADLAERLQLLELSNRSVKEEHSTTNNALSNLRKESDDLMKRLKLYESIETEYDKLKNEHDDMKAENLKLLKELDKQKAKLRRIMDDNEALNSESLHLLSHSEDLEKALINTRTELINKSSSSSIHADIMKQIDDMKKEKINSAIKIRDLLDKLEELENTISDLTENVSARDNKIAILENHINELQDEVMQLHQSLGEMVETGEQMKDISQQKISDSLHTMEAHHSKATHNMKMELAKLQSDNMKLEEILSTNKMKNDDDTREKETYISQIINLQNERNLIATDVKQLELNSVGDSTLSSDNCNVEDILASLKRIGQYIEARSSKNSSLEQTLLKLQSSYQVVQSKADEAKKIVEIEKQKILNEKEEAIRDRINMEKQLKDLKDQLEKQASRDKNIIKDLEAEIFNQKLICDKLNQSTQSYISRLKEEMQSLNQLYQSSLDNIAELEQKVGRVNDENKTYIDTIEKVNTNLQEKNKEIDLLRKKLEQLENKSIKNNETQSFSTDNKDKQTQTTEEFLYEGYTQQTGTDKIKNKEDSTDSSLALEKKEKEIPNHANQVQVLVANMEPTLDYVKNAYLNYKLKNLSTGRIEQHSITGSSQNDEFDNKDTIVISGNDKSDRELSNDQSMDKMNFIDIYNKQSMHTNSSKLIDSNYQNNEKEYKSSGKSNTTDFGFTGESSEPKNSSQKASNLFGSVSGVSTDKDLFVIYKDSDTNSNRNGNKTWPTNTNSVLVEAVMVHPDRYKAKNIRKQTDIENNSYLYPEDDELIEDDSVKQKLKISLPRVDNDSPSVGISSDVEKKSQDSYTILKHSTSNNSQYFDSNASTENEKFRQTLSKKQSYDDNSFSGPSRGLTDINSSQLSNEPSDKLQGKPQRLAMDVGDERIKQKWKIKDNVNQLANLDLDFTNITDALRKTRSDEMFDHVKTNGKTDSNSSSFDMHLRRYVDKEIMVKLEDPIEEYETKIKNLTTQLENVEKDYKKKIEAIKNQYDSNIKSIMNEHNEGVTSIQNLHEETVKDIIKHHENEVENLRSMSIDAMRKADKLEKEVRSLKYKMPVGSLTPKDEDPIRSSRTDTKTLTKTDVEAFNVKPKTRNGPCTCTLDINISDTVRNIFEQVDVDQRKIAEQMYLKYIANKIVTGTVEALDCQELSFLHLKVCRIWKVKLSKEENLQKRISSLEAEVIHKQRHNQQNIAELDRQVEEERRRLQEVRDAVCRNSPTASRTLDSIGIGVPPPLNTADIDYLNCSACNPAGCSMNVGERKSAGDLGPAPVAPGSTRQRRTKPDTNRAVLAKLDAEERRERKLYHDEPPTRLRRAHDRHPLRLSKK